MSDRLRFLGILPWEVGWIRFFSSDSRSRNSASGEIQYG